MDSCHDLDVKILTLPAVLLALALSAAGADCPKNQPKTEATLIDLQPTLGIKPIKPKA